MRLNSFLGRGLETRSCITRSKALKIKKIYIRYQDFNFIAVLLCYLVLPKGLQL